jgi:hypothetical protein
LEVIVPANLRFKDSVFSFLFNDDPDALRELYSAIEGIEVDPSIPITINTLSDVLFMERYNDISFTIGNTLVILVEHQSTVNFNMPLRFLFYIARIYEKIIDQKKEGSIYREKLIKIPFPEFLVLYNGVKPCPDKVILNLADAYEDIGGLKKDEALPELNLVVKIYNINKGHNEAIVNKCEKLKGYSTFIDQIRENNKTMALEEAVKNAIDYCIDNNVLSQFLIEHSSEVRNMLNTEWNWDDAKRVWQEEAREGALEEGIERGRVEGIEEGVISVARKALRRGMPILEVQDITGLSLDIIESLPTTDAQFGG